MSRAGFAEILLAMTATAMLQAAIARTAICQLSGRSGGLLESVAEALRLIGLVIFTSIATLFGLVMLIVPGIIFYVTMSASVPVLVEERRGVIGSIERSVELTRDSRWLDLLAAPHLLHRLHPARRRHHRGEPRAAARHLLDTPLGIALLDAAAQTIMEAVFAVMRRSYVELRTVEEGASSEALAAVLD